MKILSMKAIKVFIPKYELIREEQFVSTVKDIEMEPMLYGASWNYARDHGGMLTQRIMNEIENRVMELIESHAVKGYHPVIDTKSVMLMPGQFPCIPGWHCDGVIRKDANSQPNLATLNDDIQHFVCTLSTKIDLAPMLYLTNSIEVEFDKNAVWDSVNSYIGNNTSSQKSLNSGQILQFNRSTLHRGTAAKARGWRYFFRLSFYHMPAMNRIRNQVQVYLTDERGW